MPTRLAALLLLPIGCFLPASAHASDPVKVVEETLGIPAGMDAAEALASVEDVAAIISHFEPVVPRLPGVRLELDKELVSAEGPTVVELPVEGSAFGHDVDEVARVTVGTTAASCGEDEGVLITLDFTSSSPNIERRIDRIEITACPHVGDDGEALILATGRMYAGALPIDPSLNTLKEHIGAKALQSAFIKQVPAVFSAVESHWSDQPHQAPSSPHHAAHAD